MATTAKTVAPATPLRRQPVQERSAARVKRMLDACAELIDEVGYDDLTTTLLAERAGVAIGSVYQFFPDKKAVVQALALSHIDAFITRLGRRLEGGVFANWWDCVDAGFDEYVTMHREVPGFKALHFADAVDRYLFDPERENNDVFAERFEDFLVSRFSLERSEHLTFALRISVELGDALIQLAFRRNPKGDSKTIAEAKAVAREYLAARVEEAQPDYGREPATA